jgi:hypothetical protein
VEKMSDLYDTRATIKPEQLERAKAFAQRLNKEVWVVPRTGHPAPRKEVLRGITLDGLHSDGIRFLTFSDREYSDNIFLAEEEANTCAQRWRRWQRLI